MHISSKIGIRILFQVGEKNFGSSKAPLKFLACSQCHGCGMATGLLGETEQELIHMEDSVMR